MSVKNRISTRAAWMKLEHLDPVDLFDAWLDAENDASLMLARWRDAPDREKRDSHAGYVAALDREAHAADVLRLRLQLG